ncbi:TPA: PTS transporter subunit EIIB, partial [Aeromonas veronii]|nr:PTS transporter subunit EIIB [Aeromonas veronii]
KFKTPGREDLQEETTEVVGADRAKAIVAGLGGAANIKDVDCCATRLRVSVHNGESVSEGMLKQTGALAVITKGNGIQVIYGPHVTIIKNEIEELLGA